MKETTREEALPLQRPSTEAGEVALSFLLRGGVFAAAILLGFAWAGSLMAGKPLQVPTSFAQLGSGEMDLWDHLGAAGALTLGATPIVRVAFTIPLFARAGERLQVWVALGVLLLLGVGAFFA